MKRYLGVVVLACLLPGAEAAAQTAEPPGCYDLQLGEWLPALDIGADSLFMAPPPRVRLGTEEGRRVFGRAQGSILEPAPGGMPSIHEYSWWDHVGADSVQLIWTTGFSGLRMRMHLEAEALRGTARTFWDFGREVQTAPVVATPVACDAPLEAGARMAYRFPRGIRLAASDSIRLGEPLSRTGLDVIEGADRTFQVLERAEAPFADATGIRVTQDASGVVRQITLRFGELVSHDEMVRRLIPVLGEPTSGVGEQRPGGASTRWTSRMIWIAVVGGNEGGGPVTVYFRALGRASSGRLGT